MSSKGSLRIGLTLLLTVTFFSLIYCNTYQQQAPQNELNTPNLPIKIIFPRLYPQHYQYWLKHQGPLALKEFEEICNKSEDGNRVDPENFAAWHANLSIEDSYYLTNQDHGISVLKAICSGIKNISKLCWGYEKSCHDIYLMPQCSPEHSKDQMIKWFNQADFGFIAERGLERSKFCSPDKSVDISKQSLLECTKHFRTCRGKNLFMNLRLPKDVQSLHEKPNFIADGGIGGSNCFLESKRIKEEDGRRGFLQSWFNELEHYKTEHNYTCVESVDRVYFVKYENPTNMYDFFSTFVYLYSTMHLYQRFTDDNQIILWNKDIPQTKFNKMWSVFSRHQPKSLKEYEGKRICFKNFIFVMPPRIDNGFFHDTELPECSRTGLFHAFNRHVLYRLSPHQMYTREVHEDYKNKLIRVLILLEPTTSVENMNDFLESLKNSEFKFATKVLYTNNNEEFINKLQHVRNTDVFIGVHHPELTYTLFLPDWAAMIELTKPLSKRYHNLARFRGVDYFKVEGDNELLRKLDVKGDEDNEFTFQINVKQLLSLLEIASLKVQKNREGSFPRTEPTVGSEGMKKDSQQKTHEEL